MAGRSRRSGKKHGLTKREIILLTVVGVLIIALLVSLFAGGALSSLFSGIKDDGSHLDSQRSHYTSILSGKSNIQLPPEIDTETSLEVHFVDVGQGDAIVIMLPDGKNMIIDAGSGTKVSNEIKGKYASYLTENLALNRVDYLVVTHPDSDHVNMASAILDDYDVRNIYYNEYYEKGSQVYKTFTDKAMAEKNANIYEINEAAQIYTLCLEPYILTLIAPGNTGFAGADSEKNSMSIFCVLEYGGRKVLFTGDAEKQTEEWIVGELREQVSDVDILKVGHHGSDTSSTVKFLEVVRPEYAVISCGENNAYGHPSYSTMNALFNFGTATYRTNRHGNIVLYIDEEGDFGFLPEKSVAVDNNKDERNPFMILLETVKNTKSQVA